MTAKAMKRKFGKKVINGMPVADAWNRLERAEQEKRARRARQVSKSAGSTRPGQAAMYEPGRDAEFMQSAFAPMTAPPQPTSIQKARRAAFDRQYDQAIAPVREFIAKALQPAAASLSQAPGLTVKQLTQPEWAAVTELLRQFGRAEHDPARREKIRAQIDQVMGETGITWGVL